MAANINTNVTTTKASGIYDTQKTKEKEYKNGKTIGKPTLSEKAEKYLETLKQKYSDMDFILVSSDMKQQAQAQAASYANPVKTVVLIDEDKIEKMAEDENFRKQYESIIENARTQLPALQSGLQASGANGKGYGVKVNDNGTASFFAVMDKSMTEQREKLSEQRAEKKAKEKVEAKKKAKKEKQEALEKQHEKRRTEKAEQTGDTEVLTADSVEELLKKVSDWTMARKSDETETDEEKLLGRNIDFRG